MKVCLINNLYDPYSRGGAEQVVKNIAKGFIDDDHEVVIITTKPFRGEEKKAIEKIKIHRFFPWNLFWIGNIHKHNPVVRLVWHFFDMFNLHSYFKIKQILKKEKPDLVITHNLKGIGYLIPMAVKKSGIKYFHTIHDVQLAIPSGLLIKGEENSWQSKCVLTKLYTSINKKLFSYPQAIISPSKWLMDFYEEKGFFKNQKKEIIPNPVVDIKTSYQSLADNYQFLYVGQIEKYKGVLFLINTFNKIKNSNAELLIIGDGSKLKEAKKIANQNHRIKFLGRLPNKEVINLYKKSGITIMPSLCYENSPTVIYESLAYGTPVLASNLGGTAELIKEDVNGYIFKAGNTDDLLDKINFCLNNKDKIKKMRLFSAGSIEKFNLENYINKILNL